MKEAAGEANITVITIVLIGLVAAAGAVFIPRILDNMKARSCCNEYGGTWSGNECKGGSWGSTGANLSDLKKNTLCQ